VRAVSAPSFGSRANNLKMEMAAHSGVAGHFYYIHVLNNWFAFIASCYNRESFYVRRGSRKVSNTTIHWIPNFSRRSARRSGSHSRDCSSRLASWRQFLALHCSPRIVHHMLPGSALGESTDRVPFHSTWDLGRSGRSTDLRRFDACAA
jgi:hypothetical protein